jgi:hypothetical protein
MGDFDRGSSSSRVEGRLDLFKPDVTVDLQARPKTTYALIGVQFLESSDNSIEDLLNGFNEGPQHRWLTFHETLSLVETLILSKSPLIKVLDGQLIICGGSMVHQQRYPALKIECVATSDEPPETRIKTIFCATVFPSWRRKAVFPHCTRLIELNSSQTNQGEANASPSITQTSGQTD